MKTAKVTSRLEAPVDAVFAAFTDLENAPLRVAGIKALAVLTPGGDFRYGTRWVETREVMGRLDQAEMEVTAYERNRGYTITHHKGGARIDTVFTFEPDGDATLVTIEFAVESDGVPPGLFAPVSWAIAGAVRSALEDDLRDIKQSVEPH
jgi:uncharacterized protein YndB with AHSA1/START domain